MTRHTRAAAPYRSRSPPGSFNGCYRWGAPCGSRQGHYEYLRLIPIAVFFTIALILLSPASALPGHGDPSDRSTGDRGGAADPALTPVTNGTLSGAYTFPSIAPNNTPGILCHQYTFPFQNTSITITVRVNASLYYGAKNGDKYATVPEDVQPESMAPGYYRAFIEDTHQVEMYTDLLKSLRAIRQEHQYSDDEYLELLTVFVQSLPYDTFSGTHPDTPARFPVETLVDGTGDCDDKSLLLAGLLAREGYDTALLLFIPEHHMAVGVKDDGAQYGNTGYMYVEATGVSLVGEVPQDLSLSAKYLPPGQSPQAVTLTSMPLVIREGEGTGTFSHAGETAFITSQKKTVNARIALLHSQLDAFSGDDPSRYRELMEDYYVYTGIHNTLVKKAHDRPGEYRYLSKLAPAFLCTDSTDRRAGGSVVLPSISLAGTGTCQACFPLALRGTGQCSPGDRTALSTR
jgi:hypothetical protein